MSLFTELTRRKVFKVGGAYLVVAWLAVQAASIGFPAFDAPPWALRIFILVALLGFPIALVFAWAFELTAEGVKPESGTRSTRAILGVAAVLTALAFFWYFKGQPSYRADTPPHATAPSDAAVAVNQKSIAVLPFSDLSPAHDQEYFSDGMAEELLNALAKVKDLKVAGRTSSFSFKGKNEDLRAIGKALNVANILEGSVRKQGDKVRITAQLIRTDNDFHLWSETYDGDLSDVFALQERIARAITDKLSVALNGDPQKPLVAVATSNSEAYALYLQASGIFNRREGQRFPEAIAELEQALKLDPKFARAHARLAAIHALEPIYVPEAAETSRAATEREAALASALDPTLAEPYAALGAMYGLAGRWTDARSASDRSLALDPDDANVVFWAAVGAINSGYTRRGCELLDRVLALDPLLPNALLWRGLQYIYAGDLARGATLLRRGADVGLAHVGIGLDLVEAAQGHKEQAQQQIANGLRVLATGLPADAPAVVAAGIYGDAAAHTSAVALLEHLLSVQTGRLSAFIPFSLLRLDESTRALNVLQQRAVNNNALIMHVIWSPAQRLMRSSPEFKTFTHQVGLDDLWDRYGAPDACRRGAAGDYVCD